MARVLVVDDYPAILTMLRLTLVLAGHEVVTAADGAAGLGLVGRARPDVVLLDIDMPAMDGLTVCGELKRNQTTAGIPVLLMTGRLCVEVLDRARGAGAFAVLPKPFPRARLLEEIERAIAVATPDG